MEYNKICIICEKDFISRWNHTKVCSQECRKKWQHKRYSENIKNELEELNCRGCGERFIQKYMQQVFCNKECADKFSRINLEKSKILVYNRCKYCGKKYLWSSSNDQKIYCSEKCRKRYYERKYGKTLFKEERNCQLCNGIFIWESSKPNKRFCSKECGKEYGKKKLKEIYSISYLKIRFDIFQRDNFTCQYCGRCKFDEEVKLQVDHIIPRAKEGRNNRGNLITSCLECNQGKKDVLLEQRQLNKIKLKIKLNGKKSKEIVSNKLNRANLRAFNGVEGEKD